MKSNIIVYGTKVHLTLNNNSIIVQLPEFLATFRSVSLKMLKIVVFQNFLSQYFR